MMRSKSCLFCNKITHLSVEFFLLSLDLANFGLHLFDERVALRQGLLELGLFGRQLLVGRRGLHTALLLHVDFLLSLVGLRLERSLGARMNRIIDVVVISISKWQQLFIAPGKRYKACMSSLEIVLDEKWC